MEDISSAGVPGTDRAPMICWERADQKVKWAESMRRARTLLCPETLRPRRLVRAKPGWFDLGSGTGWEIWFV